MLKGIWHRIRTSRAALNAATSYFAVGILAVRGIVAIPIAVYYLDKEELGLWAVTNSILHTLVWADLGIGVAAGRIIADAVIAKDQKEIDAWWSTTRFILLGLGLLVILCGLPAVPWILKLFEVSTDYSNSATWLLTGCILITGLSFPLRGAPGLFTAQNRFHLGPLVQAAAAIINLAVFCFLLSQDWGLKAYVGALLISQLTIWIAYWYLIKRGANPPQFTARGMEKARIKRLFSLSGNMTIVGFVDSFLTSIPAFIIGKFGALSQVPIYTFSWRAASMSDDLCRRTLQSFYPGLQSLHVAGHKEHFLRQHHRVMSITLAVSLFAASAVLLGNPILIQLLAGTDFYAGNYVNTWFALVIVTGIMSRSYRILLLLSGSMQKHAVVAIMKLVAALVFGILGWKLAGLAGLAFVFAFLPLFNGVYCYFRGSVGCGYEPRQTGGIYLAWIAGGMMVIIAAGLLQAGYAGSGNMVDLFSKRVMLPSASSFATLLPATYGLVVLWWQFKVSSKNLESA